MKLSHFTFTLFIVLCLVQSAIAQQIDNIWYNKQWKQTTLQEERHYFRTIKLIKAKSYEVIDHYADSSPQMTGTFSSINPDIKNGLFTYYNEKHIINGKILWVDNIVAERYLYNESRNQTVHIIDADYLKTLTPEQKKEKYNIITIDKDAEYADGLPALMAFITKTTVYPLEARKQKIEGRTFVSLTIDTNGNILDAKITVASSPLLDAEALRVAKLIPGKFIPAMDKGKPITHSFNIPFLFSLK